MNKLTVIQSLPQKSHSLEIAELLKTYIQSVADGEDIRALMIIYVGDDGKVYSDNVGFTADSAIAALSVQLHRNTVILGEDD